MSYVDPNYKSKKEFKGAVIRYRAFRHAVADLENDAANNPLVADIRAVFRRAGSLAIHETYNPSGTFPTPQNGADVIEGPHYPQPHRWYARVQVQDGCVVKVLS